MTRAGVAQSGKEGAEPGEARLLASGALVQQAAQASGLVALLVVVTVLARRLSVAELGAYGLVASLAGYLLVLRNSVAAAAVRAMAGATVASGPGAHVRGGRGALRAGRARHRAADRGGRVRDRRARCWTDSWRRTRGSAGSGLGAITAAGIAASVYLDGLRAERLLVRAALTEMAGVALWLDPDAGADPLGRGPGRRDRRQRCDAAAQRAALATPWCAARTCRSGCGRGRGGCTRSCPPPAGCWWSSCPTS